MRVCHHVQLEQTGIACRDRPLPGAAPRTQAREHIMAHKNALFPKKEGVLPITRALHHFIGEMMLLDTVTLVAVLAMEISRGLQPSL